VNANKSKRIFVVHGRNRAAKNAMFEFLRALGLKPLEWEQALAATNKGAPSTIEIVRAGIESSQCVIVLFTGDDLARLNPRYGDEPLQCQARPNVIFEAGIAMARTEQKRTILVQVGPLRRFSDIDGINFVALDNSPEKRKGLVKRLKTAGCEIDDSGSDYLVQDTGGDFDLAYAANQTLADIQLLRERLISPVEGTLFLNAYGLADELRKDGLFQNFRAAGANVEPVQFMWADSRHGDWIKTKLDRDQAYLRVEFCKHEGSLGCNLSIRPQDNMALLTGEYTGLAIDARIPADSELEEVGIGLRLVNGYMQHWTLHESEQDPRIDCLRTRHFNKPLVIDLRTGHWKKFRADGTCERGPQKADFSILCSINLSLGDYREFCTTPGAGTGALEINDIRLC
jgi:hypothetical protein